MSDVLETSLVEQGRSALARHSWREAYDLLSRADAEASLSPDDLELLAEAAWWTGRLPLAIDARERAYAAYLKAGDPAHAAMTATLISQFNLLRGERAVAAAWVKRAERHLEGMPENVVHGWLAAAKAFRAALGGTFDEALPQARIAREMGTRFNDRDLEADGMSIEGLSLIYLGQVDEGLALVDEATILAFGGDLRPDMAGSVSCTTIEACASLGDWARAAEWTDAQDRWCKRENINGFPGMCRLHRAEIKTLRGDWLEAEAEARHATDELAGFVPAAIGLALYEIGVIRLRRGDLAAAEEALLRAHGYGYDPEPALSLLRLAQGRAVEAAASIRRSLDEPLEAATWGTPPASDLGRLQRLPAQAEIALANEDLATARTAATELRALAERFANTASAAAADATEGSVLLAEGNAGEAIRLLRRAVGEWAELGAPYETARARVVLAGAYQADGDADRAVIELQTARSAFETLGADADRRRVEETLSAFEAGGTAFLGGPAARVMMTFVFTDIVDSTRQAEALGDEAWGAVKARHDQLIRSILAQHGGQEVKGTGDGFFLAFGDAVAAIECAIGIQRALAGRLGDDAAPLAVRIGVHQAEAMRAGQDYVGVGVNQAARIGAVASGGEILVSASTLSTSRRSFAERERRTVELRGISAPVEVVSLDWS